MRDVQIEGVSFAHTAQTYVPAVGGPYEVPSNGDWSVLREGVRVWYHNNDDTKHHVWYRDTSAATSGLTIVRCAQAVWIGGDGASNVRLSSPFIEIPFGLCRLLRVLTTMMEMDR